MENREKVVAEYFKLRVMLNRGNIKTNQKTDVDFVYSRRGLEIVPFATLKGVDVGSKIELCRQKKADRWSESGFSGLWNLESFCASFCRHRLGSGATNDEIDQTIDALANQLRSLGISS